MADRRIYTDEDAARYFKASAGKPYRPSNGTEGEMFQAAWCAQCEADRAFRDNPDHADGCPIILAVMGEPKHKAFPGLFKGVRREHSRKPDEFYRIVEQKAPRLFRRADVFGRQIQNIALATVRGETTEVRQ